MTSVDPELMTVHAALTAVMGEVQAVGKDGRNTQQGFNFRGIDAVVNAVGPALRKHGVITLPRVLSSRYGTFTTGKGTLMHECFLEVEFTFVGPDGSTLVCSAMGESADSGDKATPKAHSVAYRTALLQALCIPTDEPDPDSSVYERVEQVAWATAKQREEMKRLSKALGAEVASEVKGWAAGEGFDMRRLTENQASAVIEEMERRQAEQPVAAESEAPSTGEAAT